jgi:hypothetical protein
MLQGQFSGEGFLYTAMPRKTKNTHVDPTVQAADTTSRRALIGGLIVAAIAAVAAIIAALINSYYGNILKPLPSPTPSTQTFAGRIIEEITEKRIRGAKVSLEGENVPPVAYSDSEGIFSFPVTDQNKEVRVRIEVEGYDNFDRRMTPSKNNGIQEIRLTPKADKTAELSGSVLDRNDKPLQGAKISLDDVSGMPAVETSSNGVFSFQSIPRKYGEMVRIRVVMENYQPNPYTEDFVLGKTPPRIKLTRKR